MGRVNKREVITNVILDIIENIRILSLIESIYSSHIDSIIPAGTWTRKDANKHVPGHKEKNRAQKDIPDFPELFANRSAFLLFFELPFFTRFHRFFHRLDDNHTSYVTIIVETLFKHTEFKGIPMAGICEIYIVFHPISKAGKSVVLCIWSLKKIPLK